MNVVQPGGGGLRARRSWRRPWAAAIDLLFGGGHASSRVQADAGRLVDSGFVAAHPELFGDRRHPPEVGEQAFWDRDGPLGRHLPVELRHLLQPRRAGAPGTAVPSSWEDLANPRLLRPAGPGRSQQERLGRHHLREPDAARRCRWRAAAGRGWAQAVWLIRRIGGNARYWSDSSASIPLDVADGEAAAGMCIDFTAASRARPPRPQPATPSASATRSRAARPSSTPTRSGCCAARPTATWRWSSSSSCCPRRGRGCGGLPHGTPGRPRAVHAAAARPSCRPSTQRREPTARTRTARRATSATRPPGRPRSCRPSPSWFGPCASTPQAELGQAYGALAAARFPPQATAAFDDLTLVDYPTLNGPIRAALHAPIRWRRRPGRAAWCGSSGSSTRAGAALARQGR